MAYLPRAWKPEPSARITLWVNTGITVHLGSSMLLHLCVCVRRVDAAPPWLQRSTSWQLQSSFSGRCLNSVSVRGSASESKHTMTSESQQLALLTIPEHELRETVITPSMVVARSCMHGELGSSTDVRAPASCQGHWTSLLPHETHLILKTVAFASNGKS